MAARAGSWTLPEWQDDGEVTSCPICGHHFGLLYRRHHCRRCGKVICASCSRHRITLPHAFIVRPPEDSLQSGHQVDDGEDATSPSTLTGSETVRVCNPCVPDPNYGPPPRYDDELMGSRAHFNDGTQYTFPAYNSPQGPTRSATFHSPRRSPDRTQPDRYRTTVDPTSPSRRTQGARTYYSRRTNSDAVPAHEVLEARFRRRENQHDWDAEDRVSLERGPRQQPSFDFTGQAPSGNTWQQFARHGRMNSGAAAMADHYGHGDLRSRPIPGRDVPFSSTPPPGPRHGTSAPTLTRHDLPPLPPPPRMRITGRRPAPPPPPAEPVREEDECPVCGTTEPPFGRSSGGADDEGRQTARERHIEACITSHLSFNSPSRDAPVSSDHSRAQSVPVAAVATTDGTAEGSPGWLGRGALAGPSSWIAARLPALSTPPAHSQSSALGGTPPFSSSSSSSSPQQHFPGSGSSHHRPRAPTTGSMPQAQPQHQQQRMLVYHATEKDCQGDDGNAGQECVICLEEFEVGDDMGRLECLCKFHRRCIRGWWESVAGGARWGTCPTHTLHS